MSGLRKTPAIKYRRRQRTKRVLAWAAIIVLLAITGWLVDRRIERERYRDKAVEFYEQFYNRDVHCNCELQL